MQIEPISISVKNVKKIFGTQTALSDISINFKESLMHGLIGPAGAGKTTLLRILMKLLNPNSGSVEYIKNKCVIDFDELRPFVAYMPQSQSLYPDLSVKEHLEFFRDLYGISKETYQKLSTELLAITRLQPFLDRPAGQLSGGMYKKLGLICALLRSPQIIFLDEPTNGVDPISRREFWELLYKLADQKILIIVTTSYMDEVERCSIVHLIEDGRLIAEGEPRELLKKENVKNFDELFIKYTNSSRMQNSHGEFP